MIEILKAYVKRYNDWILSFSKKKEAEKSLASFSFAESSVFPIPIDPLLIAMILARPKRTKKLVNIAAFYSVLGALVGYFIGAVLIGTIGDWLIDTYDIRQGFDDLGVSYSDNAFLAVITAAFTPIPFKLITISAGAFSINIFTFLIASIIGRYARYSLVGWFSRIVGLRYKDKVHYFINLLSVVVISFIVIVILVATN